MKQPLRRMALCACVFGVAVHVRAEKGDLCNCLQTPEEIVRMLQLPPPTREMFPRLSNEEIDLLLEYWDQWETLQRFYSNLTMTGTKEETFRPEWSTPRLERWSSKVSYYSAPGRSHENSFRVDLEKTRIEAGEVSVVSYIIHGEENFVLGRDSQTGRFFLKERGKNRQDAYWEFAPHTPHCYPFVTAKVSPIAPTLVFDVPQENRHNESGVVSVRRRMEGEEELVDVDYRYSPTSEATFTFLRGRTWALKRKESTGIRTFEEGGPEFPYRLRTVCEYSSADEGVPRLASFENLWWLGTDPEPSDETLLERTRFVTTSIVPGGARPEDFDVASLLGSGIRLPDQADRSLWWIPVLIGFLFFVLGVWFLSRRAEPPEQFLPADDGSSPR